MMHLKEELWELLFNSIDEGFCIIEVIFDEKRKPIDYRFLVINTCFERQTGLVNAAGKTMRELAPSHEEHWFEIYGKIALTGESIRFENRAEQLGRWFDVYAFRFGDPQNFQVAILFNDITERKRSEETIRLLNEELAAKVDQLEYSNKKLIEAEKTKSEFFANVSHELRTPLSLILGPLESILSGKYGQPNPEHDGLLKAIHNNAIRLLQMVNGLLDFSKFEAGKMVVHREPTDLAATIKTILGDFESMLAGKKIFLSYHIGFKDKYVLMDRYLFERILFNLLSNAAKFTRQGGKVHVNAILDKSICNISIADTGIGIPESALTNLFQKFTQVEGSSTRRFEGTGLGLAMVKEFSELLGGSVTVKSKLGEGSVFSVSLSVPETNRLPLGESFERRTLLPQYQTDSVGERRTREEVKTGYPKVLVCEDNEELRSYIITLLDPFCDIRTAGDGEQALELVHTWSPDVVLSDVMMPKKDGIALCTEIKSNTETSKTIVVLLTAMTHRDAMLRGWEAKADEYLFKPFHPEELITRIRSLLSAVRERKIADALINKKNKELADANADLESFSYSVSHDLRAPLRSISAYSKILTEDYGDKLGDNGKRDLNVIVRNISKMNKLIEDLLMLSKLGRKELEKYDLDTMRLVQGLVNEMQKNSNANIILNELLPAKADHGLITQVWINLLSNAVKYSSKKENPVVEIGSSRDNGEVVYYVKDNGAGFSMDYANKLFGVFQRLHKESDFQGTGIGLALVKRIVGKHHGRVWAEGKVNEGATFYFSLPASA